jgi:TRAP-type C4-dicarboxylate transport system permease large subunit
LSWKGFKEGSVEAGVTIGMVGILLVGCLIFNKFLAISGVPQAIARFIGGIAQSPLETLWIIVVIYLIMGCFIDALSITLLTVPIFYPVIVHAGIDPIHFGVVLTVSMIIGTLTPPFGIIVYAMKGAVKDVPLFTIFRGTYPFIFAMIILVALVIHIPQMSTWLPALMITNR